jgi:aspartyl-tRNA(Asn)/glutamyl-tRNA(Gln) amidotransferase subunit C
MARVTPESVAHVAKLAHLSLTEEERRLFTRQLGEVLEHAESLASFDAASLPEDRATEAAAFREDEPRAGIPGERALEAAPDAAERLFRVPRVIPG